MEAVRRISKLSAVSTVSQTIDYGRLTDVDLVLLCQQNDHRAFDLLVRRHQRTVAGILRRQCPDWTDTADLTQEVFLRMWRGMSSLKNPHALKRWIGQIATNVFYDELRKRPKHSFTVSLDRSAFDYDDDESGTRDVKDEGPGPEEILQRKEIEREVKDAIAMLPRNFRTAIVLRDLEDLPYEDIASITGTELGTIKSRIARARSKVQKLLKPHFEDSRSA